MLINNAGILHSVATHEATFEQWEQTIAVNLTGTYCCLRAVLPGMLRRKAGRIINVSSELGLIGFPTYAAYSASKGGVIALTKAVAKEVAPHGILVNSIAPGRSRRTCWSMIPSNTTMRRDCRYRSAVSAGRRRSRR